MKNSEINLYIDGFIIEAILNNNKLIKQADSSGMVLSLINKVKEYVESHIDPNNKSESLINILGPGAISVAFSAMGLGWIGMLIGLAMRVFNINTNNIIASIWDKLSPAIANDKQISSSQIDSFVQDSVNEHSQSAIKEEPNNTVNPINSKSFNKLIRDANFVKLAMINYENKILIKDANIFDSRKLKTVSILTRVLSWIFKIALASAGLLVAGDVVNKFLGRSNSIGNTKKDAPEEDSSGEGVTVSNQTKFPIKSGYVPEKNNINNNWVEKISNDPESIGNMLINFAKTVYDGLDDKDNLIKSSPSFQMIKDKIAWYNHTSPGSPMIWIPKYYHSKKQIVDYFIDNVAQKIT